MTIAPRWRKVLRDFGEGGRVRTALAVLAMAAGTFGLGMVLSSYAILHRELARTFADTRPASAMLVSDRVSDALADSIRRLPGVSDCEVRATISGRIRVGPNQWAPLVLFAVRDYSDLRLDRFKRARGAWPPAAGEVLIERTGLSVARARIGEGVVVKTANGVERTLRVAGTVHAAGLAPAWMDHVVSGFVSWNSIARGDSESEATSYSVLVDAHRSDSAHIIAVAGRVRTWLGARGVRVRRIEVPPPGRHPHADQMDTFLFLLGAFGALTLCLSAVLVTNMVYTLLAKQLRQVGVMKAIGATTAQIATLYLAQVFLMAVIALAIGLPLGLAAGQGYARFATRMLNASIVSAAAPAWVVVLQLAVGLVIPLLVSLGPVYRASRVTVRQALHHEDGTRNFGSRRLDRWLARTAWLPRPLGLSLRTTLYRRGRLLLTVGTLAAGGAAFISASNVAAGWDRVIANDFAARRYDVDVRLSHPQPASRIAAALARVPEVVHAEYWAEGDALRPGASRGAHDRIRLLGPDPGSALLDLPLLEGRWLRADDTTGVVINHALAALDPTLAVGRPIRLSVNQHPATWAVLGITKEIAAPPTVYARPGTILEAMGQSPGLTRGARVVTRAHDLTGQVAAARAIERALERAGLGVGSIQPRREFQKALKDHLVIIMSALLLAASLVILVGGLGLTSTLALNVVERTRELGILGAIGATPRTIGGYVVFEGVLMGVLSWVVAIAAAVPATMALDDVAGRLFIRAPLDFTMSPSAVLTWLALVVVLATLSSLYPAWRAAHMTVREALTYE